MSQLASSNTQQVDVNAVVEAAIRIHQYDFARHTAAVVGATGVNYQHVWEITQVPGVSTLFGTDTGLILVKKVDAPPDPRGASLTLREITPEEADELLETPEVLRFLDRYDDVS